MHSKFRLEVPVCNIYMHEKTRTLSSVKQSETPFLDFHTFMPKDKRAATAPTSKSSRAVKQPPSRSSPEKRAKKAKKTKTAKGQKKPDPPRNKQPLNPLSEEYQLITDPSEVRVPDPGLIHPALLKAWVVYRENPMWFLFDSTSPARHFKCGVPYREDKDFPGYGKHPSEDLTETDDEPPGLMPYGPWAYRYIFRVDLIPWSQSETLCTTTALCTGLCATYPSNSSWPGRRMS
jgi:hypothetical protein